MSGVVLGNNNITINGRIIETGKTIVDLTSSPSVPKITINSDFKYMTFINDNPILIYDFNPYNDLVSWSAYANTIPTATHFFDSFQNDGIWASSTNVGFFEMTLPNTHNYMEISYGNSYTLNTRKTQLLLNGVVVDEVFDNDNKIFKSTYSGTPTFRISENFSIVNANIIIKLFNTKKTYNITFNEQTEVQLLLLDSTKYIVANPFNISSGSLQLIVGNNGSFSSFSGVSTGTNGIVYGSGFVSTIIGTNVTYNTPQVIIRYKYSNVAFLAQWTYSASNPNVFHLGNVGIGTTNPTSSLHVLGSVQVNGAINATSLTANTKNFKIEHPLNINKWLYHGCVESPRFDNIYRGKKKIINGIGEVDIDEECNTTGGMTKGTFVALNTNCQVYLQNKESFARVKGIINGSKITINCNNTEEIEVDWLVIGERKDENIKSNELTNNEGKLICEHEMD